jgi:LacI family transcriptional regulator
LIDLVFTALDSPYSVEVLLGVTSSPMDVVVSSLPDPSDSRPWSSGLASAGRSGAIVFASSLNPLDQHIFDPAHVPYVLIDPEATVVGRRGLSAVRICSGLVTGDSP